MKTSNCFAIFFIITLMMAFGCVPKKHSFTVEAPPKYSSEHKIETITVKPFKSNKAGYGQEIASKIKNGIAQQGYMKVVPAGGKGIITGRLDVGDFIGRTHTKEWECEYKGKKEICREYFYIVKCLIKADYSLYSEKEKSAIYGDTFTLDFNETFPSAYVGAKTEAEAIRKAPSKDSLIAHSIQAIANKIVQDVTPHKEKIARELVDAGDDSIKLGITYLENGRADQAVGIWEQVSNQTASGEIKAAALYNIGVVKESQGMHQDAFKHYSEANQLNMAKELYIQAMTRAEQNMKRESNFKKWKKDILKELVDAGDKNVRLGITYLENGRTEQAIGIWEKVVKETSSDKIKAAALYDIGIAKESQDMNQDAFKYYSEANKLDMTNVLYIKAMTRAEQNMKREGKSKE